MQIKKYSLYLDTSVIGGFFDKEFSDATRQLFKEINAGKYEIFISDLTLRELLKAPAKVKTLLHEMQLPYNEIIVTNECIALAKEYMKEQVVGQSSMDDCIHIATATVNNTDLLVSWNFKHIVNVHRIRGYNSVNIKNGYSSIEIRSPKDIINYDTKEI